MSNDLIYYVCPVCDYNMNEPPSNYNVCEQCGTEFGVDDEDKTYEEIRKEWIGAGKKSWFRMVADAS